MAEIELIESTKVSFRLSWKDFPPIQHLLDVISSILAEEYITIAKQNPAVFSGKEIASGTSCPRNDNTINGGKK